MALSPFCPRAIEIRVAERKKGREFGTEGIIDFLDVLAFSPCAFASNGKIGGGRVVKRKGLSFILWT